MPQPSIPFESGSVYHVWTHANGGENLFLEEENYRFFLDKYIHHVHPVAETFAYCLMPNHLHVMIRVRGEEVVLGFLRTKKDPNLQGFENLGGFSNAISRQFSNLFNSYTKSFNKKYNRKGSLFIPNFRRKLIGSDRYFSRLITYIHTNPVHHGFTGTAGDWPHSSWHAYLAEKKTRICREEGLSWFGGREVFVAAHQNIKLDRVDSVWEE